MTALEELQRDEADLRAQYEALSARGRDAQERASAAWDVYESASKERYRLLEEEAALFDRLMRLQGLLLVASTASTVEEATC